MSILAKLKELAGDKPITLSPEDLAELVKAEAAGSKPAEGAGPDPTPKPSTGEDKQPEAKPDAKPEAKQPTVAEQVNAALASAFGSQFKPPDSGPTNALTPEAVRKMTPAQINANWPEVQKALATEAK